MSLESKVWSKLSTIDVSQFVEKKGGLDYLPWSDAWCILMNNFPKSHYTESYKVMGDGTVMCNVTVTIWEDDQMVSRHMWLPVMDYKNQPIITPTARDISDTYMRCLVKCLAMFGLGLNLYTGDSLPVNEAKATEEQLDEVISLIKASKADVIKFEKVFGEIHLLTEKKANKAIEMLNEKIRKQEQEDDNS